MDLMEMKNWLMEEESGQGMVEYGLIIVLIAIAAIGALKGVATGLNNKFGEVATELGATKP